MSRRDLYMILAGVAVVLVLVLPAAAQIVYAEMLGAWFDRDPLIFLFG